MKKILPCSDKTREFVSSLLLLAVCLIFGPAGAQAANVTWSGTTSSTWSTGTNWTGGAPVAADTAEFTAGTPANQPTVTASTAVTGLTLTVNPIITINSGQTLTVSGAAGTTGAAGITLKGAGLLSFTATGTNLAFGSGTITLDGGGFGLTGTDIAINTTTGLPTGGGGTDRSLTNNIEVTANGGRLAMNGGSGASSAAIAFNTLSLGGALTMSSGGGGGTDGYTLAGTVTLLQDVGRTLRLKNDTGHNGSDWLAGQITDGAGAAGNALRIAVTGRTLQLSNSTNNYAGGTVIVNSGANTYSYLDVTSAATLGTGNLTMESGGRIRLNNATATGVAGNLASAATISAVAGSAVGVNGTVNIADRFTASSAGVYGIEGTRSYSLNMSTLGNGKMYLGTVTGGSYNGTLTAGADSTYRLGGGSAVASLTAATTANILTLTRTNMLTGSNKLIVGSGLNTNASAGRVTMAASQDFVGGITVNSDGLLATSIAGGTPFGNTANTIEVFGQLAATGVNGSFNSAVLPNITFRPGSYLVFNNDLFNNTTGGNNNDRWSDSQAIALNGSRINLQGARSSDTSEAVGAVTFSGNSRLQLTRASTSGQDIQLTPVSLTRSGASTLAIVADGSGSMAKLGGDTANESFRVVLSGGAPTLLNGSTMVAPSIIVYEGDSNGNAAAGAFLTYNSANGTNVPGTRGFTAATFSSTNLNTAGSTDIVNAAATALSSNRTVYALKVTGAITASGSNKTVTIGSGTDSAGLIDEANNVTHTAIFDFGAREAIIWKLSGNPSTYNGIKTSGGLIKSGTSAITLAGASTGNMSISGGVTVNQGQINITTANSATDMADNLLTVNHEGTFNIQDNNVTVAGLSGVGSGGNVVNSGSSAKTLTLDFNSSSQTYEGRLQGTGTAANLSLVKNGNGTQVFGANSTVTYTGNTTVVAGTLRIDTDASAATGSITINSTGTLQIGNNGATGRLSTSSSLTNNGTLTFSRSDAITQGVDFNSVISGSGAVVQAGSGNLILTGANTYSGSTTISAGTLRIGDGGTTGSLGSSSAIANEGTLVFNRSNTVTQGVDFSTVISGNGSLVQAGSGNLTLSGTNTYSGSTTISAGTLRIGDGGTTGSLGSSSAIANEGTLVFNRSNTVTQGVDFSTVISGSGSLVQAGSGNLTLSGTNTYSGSTTISAGTLQIGNGGTTGALSTSSTITNNASLAFNRSNTVTQGVDFSTVISGNGSLVQAGSGNLILTGANTYSGSTTISAGTLRIGDGGTTGSLGSSSAIANEGTLVFNRSNTVTQGVDFSTVISGSGSLVQAGSGNLTLSGTNTYSGSTIINAGTVSVTGSIANSSTAINSGGTLLGTGTTGAVTVSSGALIGAGSSSNSVGTLTVGDLTLSGGGGYTWDISNTAGTAGTNWDLISASSTTVTATSGNKFTIYLTGNPLNWSPSTTYSSGWNILSWGSGVTGFDADAFILNAGDFSGAAPTGTWSFSNSSGYLKLVYTAPSSAADWTGGSGNWSSGANWQGGSAPSPGSSTPLVFSGSGGVSTNDNQLTTVSGITFGATGSYTVNGSAINLSGGITNNSSYAQTVALSVTLSAAQTFAANSGNLIVSGALNTNGNPLLMDGANTVVISGDMSGAGSLTKNGSGSLTLSGSNSYSGTTTLNAGTLTLQGSLDGTSLALNNGTFSQAVGGSISGTGATLTVSGATVTLAGNNSYTGATTLTAGTLNLDGSLSGSDITVSSSGTWNQSATGSISGAGNSFTLAGGTATLAGNNSYTGATTVNAGTLTLQGGTAISNSGPVVMADAAGAELRVDASETVGNLSGGGSLGGGIVIASAQGLTVSQSSATTYSGVLSGAGAFLKAGSGTLTINGTNTFAGGTIISAGNLTLAGGAALADSGAVSIADAAGAVLHISANETIGSLSGGGSNGGNVSIASAQVLTVNQTTDGNFAGRIVGSGALTKAGSGTLTLSGANTLSGNISISAGNLTLDGSLSGSDITVSSGTWNQSATGSISGAGNSFTLAGGTANLDGSLSGSDITVSSGTWNQSATGSISGAGNSFTLAGGTANLDGSLSGSDISVSGGNFNQTGAISGSSIVVSGGTFYQSASGSITGSGKTFTLSGGAATFNGTNTYTGATTINSGTLSISGGNALSDSGSIVTANAAGAALQVNGSETIGGLSGGGATGGGIVIASGQTLSVSQSTNTTFSGNISGDAAFTKTGSGTLTLNGTNSFTGITTIAGGNLTIAGSASLLDSAVIVLSDVSGAVLHFGVNKTIASLSGGGSAGGDVSVASGRNLAVVQGGNTTFGGRLIGSGSFTKNGSGTLTLSGANTLIGNISIAGGNLTVSGGSAIANTANVSLSNTAGAVLYLADSEAIGSLSGGGGRVIVESGKTLTINQSAAASFLGALSGNGDIVKSGNSNLQLEGNSSFSGSVTVNSGGLSLASSSALGASASIVLADVTNTVLVIEISNSIGSLSGGGAAGGNITTHDGNPVNKTLTLNQNTDTTYSGRMISAVALTKNGTGTLTLAGNNTHNGTTIVSGGTLRIGNGGTTGSLSGLGNLTTNATLAFNRSNTVTQGTEFRNVITGTGVVAQVGTGTLVLNGNNTYSGKTLVQSGTLAFTFGNTTATATQALGTNTALDLGVAGVSSGLLDYTGTGAATLAKNINALGHGNDTIRNSGTGLLTLSGTLTKNGTTLTLNGGANGINITGSIVGANANSDLVVSGGNVTLSSANTYNGPTIINSGTLTANATNALGTTTNIDVNGGSLLVTAADAVNNNASINLNGGRLAVSGNFNENVGALTLSSNSVIDFSGFSGVLRFGGIGSWAANATLAIWNWSGTTYWGTQVNNYAAPSNLVFTNNSSISSNLANISFYSDSGSSFVGSGFEMSGFSGGGSQIIAVPEAETWVAATILTAAAAYTAIRRRRKSFRFPLRRTPA